VVLQTRLRKTSGVRPQPFLTGILSVLIAPLV
jgi:hypothetical protein